MIVIRKETVLDAPIAVEALTGVTFCAENRGHQFVISCTRGGMPVPLSGSVSARFVRANGTTIVIAGEGAQLVDGNAVITLHQDCYNVPGRFHFYIFNSTDSDTTCIYSCTGTVQRTQVGELIDSGDVVPSLDDIIAKQAELAQDVADASSAITSAQNAVSYLAPVFSTSRTYAVGEYVTKDGSLYICTTAVETAGAWDAANWQSVTFGGEAAYLKSSVNTLDEEVLSQKTTFCTLANGTIANPGNSNAVKTSAIPCANGDTVTIVPVRPNTDGYYYQYAYCVYSASNTRLINMSTADAGNNDICINAEDAAYIQFVIFEYNGTSYNPLREATYGYTPYATVTSDASLKSKTDSLYTNIKLPVTLEVGVNRYLNNNGKIAVSSDSKRASTVPTQIQYKDFYVVCNPFYKWTMYASEDGITYSEIETNIIGKKHITLTPANYVFFQIKYAIENAASMTYKAIDFHLVTYNLSEELGSLISSTTQNAIKKYESEIADGTIANQGNQQAINTATYIPVNIGDEVECHIDRPVDADGYYYVFAWRLYAADKSTQTAENYNALLSNNVVTVGAENSKYIRFSIFQTNGSGEFIPLRISNVDADDIYITIRQFDASASHTKAKSEATIIGLKKTSTEAYGECDAKFLFATDIHGDIVRTQRMADLIHNWRSTYFSALINGGDTVVTKNTESLDWYDSAISDLPVISLNTVGNHDAWTGYNTLDSDPTNTYNLIIAPIASSSGIVQPANAAVNGYNYYYKDFGTLRVIVLDCMYWDDSELSWLGDTLTDAKTNGKHVLCVTHAAFPWANMETVDCLWSKAGMLTNYYDGGAVSDPTRTPISAAGAVKSFIDGGGTFVCWLTGHQHGDDLHKLPDYNNQMVVTMGSFAQRASMLQKSDNQADYNYDCLTYIAVDCTNKCIKFLRIGADIDMYGIKHDGLSIRYDRADPIVTTW